MNKYRSDTSKRVATTIDFSKINPVHAAIIAGSVIGIVFIIKLVKRGKKK